MRRSCERCCDLRVMSTRPSGCQRHKPHTNTPKKEGGGQAPTYRATTTPPSVLCLRNEVRTRIVGLAADASAPEILPEPEIFRRLSAEWLVLADRQENCQRLLGSDSLSHQSTDRHTTFDYAYRLDLVARGHRQFGRLRPFTLCLRHPKEGGHRSATYFIP